MATERCRLGLPAWAFPGWRGVYFRRSAAALADYARVFDCVEGNTTFYRVPEARQVEAWREAVAGTDFRFCFKLPRPVTHDRRADFRVLDEFLAAIEPLGDHLGPLLVQFPEWTGPSETERIEAVIRALPGERRHALEVRNEAFFREPEQLEPLLDKYRLGRITLDARALHRGDPDHPEVRAARHEKPDLPVSDRVYNDLRFVRLVLHPGDEDNQRWIEHWADRIAGDLAAGREAYVLIHCPNNLHCPPFARRFHEALARRARTPPAPLPPWPTGLPA